MTVLEKPAPAETLVLVDLSAIFWSAWHATADQDASGAFQATIQAVNRIASKHDRVAICCDSGRSWRKDVFAEYKANRPEKDHASLGELDRVRDRLKADGFLLWAQAGMEADDIIATAVAQATRRDPRIGHVVIASADKDLLQLVCGGVSCLSTKTWTELGPAEVQAKFGVAPEQMGAWIALVGDSSDNIPGVKGVGAKTAADLLTRFKDVTGIYRAVMAEDEAIKPKVREALMNSETSLALAQKLVALRTDAAIDVAQVFEERTVEPVAKEALSVSELDEGNDSATEPPPVDMPPADAPPPPVDMTANTQIQTVEAKPTQLAPIRFDQALEPMSLGAAYKLAVGLFNSRLYLRFPNAEAIWAVIIRGREMGVGALTALDVFHVIEGRPSPHAHFIIARTMQHPDCEHFMCTSFDGEHATWETKHRRNPKSQSLTYTLAQAKASGLPKLGRNGNPNQWMVRPDEMLRKTAGCQLSRLVYPSAAMGLYSVAELGGDED